LPRSDEDDTQIPHTVTQPSANHQICQPWPSPGLRPGGCTGLTP